MAWKLAHKCSVIFRHQVKGGSFPVSWRLADVVPVPIRSSSSDVGDYRPIFITPVLSMVFEKIVTNTLSHFLEGNSLLLPSQFSYRKSLGTCDTLLTLFHQLQVTLDLFS